MTKAVLFPDPEGRAGGIYRTGDLGHLLPDGRLIHRGRKDSQVKVRGFRIEPVEIEMALLRSDLVKQAIIRTQRNDSGEQRLVAYIISAVERTLTVSELRYFLEKELPDYMIPFSFVVIKAFPLTPSGKIDRQSLPDPGIDRPLLDAPFIEPRTSSEEEVATIWSDVLGLKRVGIHDPFLELGGDSLRATQVISRVLHKFQVDVPMHTLLETATVAAMAEIIVNHMADEVGDEETGLLLTEIEGLSDEEAQQRLIK